MAVNEDGTVTATIGTARQTFPDFHKAAEWAETLLYGKEGEDSG